MAGAYSFLDVHSSIVGPGGGAILSEGGVAEEGITVAMRDPKNVMTIGADGTPMHSLHASKGGTATVHLQKTSPLNAVLKGMYDFQTTTAAFHGRNVISISNPVSRDEATLQAVAFQKVPDFVNATDAGMMEWVFDVGIVDVTLGTGASY